MTLANRLKVSLLTFNCKLLKIKKIKDKSQSVSFENAKKVLILVHVSEDPNLTESLRLMKLLEKEGKDVRLWVCHEGEHTPPSIPSVLSISIMDINYFGNIHSESLKHIFEESYDLLYLIGYSSSPLVEYLLLKAAASCKIGAYNPQLSDRFDMMFHSESTTEIPILIDNFLKYSRRISV